MKRPGYTDRIAYKMYAEGSRPHAFFVYTLEDARRILQTETLRELRDLGFGPVVLFGSLYAPPEGCQYSTPKIDGYVWLDSELMADVISALRDYGFEALQYISGRAVRAGMGTRHYSAAIRFLAWCLEQDIDGFYADNAEVGTFPTLGGGPENAFFETAEVFRELAKSNFHLFHHSSRTPHAERYPVVPPVDKVPDLQLEELLDVWRYRPASWIFPQLKPDSDLYRAIKTRLAELGVNADEIPFLEGRSWTLDAVLPLGETWTLTGESNIPPIVHPLDWRWQIFASNLYRSDAIAFVKHPEGSPLYRAEESWYPVLPFHLIAARAAFGRPLDVWRRYYQPHYLKAKKLWESGNFELAKTIRPSRARKESLEAATIERPWTIKEDDSLEIPLRFDSSPCQTLVPGEPKASTNDKSKTPG